jgi:hypothetical protein
MELCLVTMPAFDTLPSAADISQGLTISHSSLLSWEYLPYFLALTKSKMSYLSRHPITTNWRSLPSQTSTIRVSATRDATATQDDYDGNLRVVAVAVANRLLRTASFPVGVGPRC